MLSKLKSEVAPEEKRRVTRQMTAAALDSRNPLHIPEILENVLEFVPVDDLKSCRLVNRLWKEAALKPMRKKSAHITFRDYEGYHGLKDMERFLQCFIVANSSGSGFNGVDRESQMEIPCTKFELYMDIIKQSSDRDKLIVANFLQAISHSVTEIDLKNRGNDLDYSLKGLVEKLKFPYLRKSGFRWIGTGNHNTNTVTFNPWMSVFIKNSPRLEEIYFWAYPTMLRNIRDPSITLLLDVLHENRSRNRNINELTISAQLENEDFLKLSSSGLKLKYLCLVFDNSWQKEKLKALFEFMETQCESLKQLIMFNNIESALQSVSFFVQLPRMKNLSSLLFKGCSIGIVNYGVQFPALKNVFLVELNKNNWLQYLQPEMEPTNTVTYLTLHGMDLAVETIFEAVRIFPSVKMLQLSAFPLGLPIVYNSWPNLQDLTFLVH